MSENQPPSPRSPRPTPLPDPLSNSNPAAPPPNGPPPPPFPPGALIGLNQPPPPPRASLSSMLFLTAFFFLMSGGNNPPNNLQSIEIGPDGSFVRRVSEVEHSRLVLEEFRGFVNGTGSGNWTEPPPPRIFAQDLLPPEYTHKQGPFFTNITGFYRESHVHTLNFSSSTSSSTSSSPHSLTQASSQFFRHLDPSLLTSLHGVRNETREVEMRGTFDWGGVDLFEMNLKERKIDVLPGSLGDEGDEYEEWSWVKGSATLFTYSHPATSPLFTLSPRSPYPPSNNSNPLDSPSINLNGEHAKTPQEITYNFYGLHHIPNGTYNLLAKPDGYRVDIRDIPRLYVPFGGAVVNITRGIILRELEREVKREEGIMISPDYREEPGMLPTTHTKCPLQLHLTLPQLPPSITPSLLALYESEQTNPTGLKWSLPSVPNYWETGVGLGGMVVAEECGFGFGIEGGNGVGIDDFWRKSVHYAAFATLIQLTLLLLLVRQMESTRTPSTLSKVSLWSIVIMGISDSWVFSAHVVVGIVSDNKTSLPMLVPGFLCLCTAVIFGPRYAVLLHRIQAPERVVAPRPAATAPATVAANGTPITAVTTTSTVPPIEDISFFRSISNRFRDSPGLIWLFSALLLYFTFMFALQPSLAPMFLFLIYSFWLPQIYRNAVRGTSNALDWWFVIGTSIGRLGLPLYAFACPDNVFFTKPNNWIWGLVAWQWFQILVLFAQDRFGSGFFLPKSYSPPESYNYHPLLPSPDPENPSPLSNLETTCSICMELVHIHPLTNGPSSEALLGLNARRGYALAPCHHLFHTKCLSQWLAIKTICPLCKRSLPPL